MKETTEATGAPPMVWLIGENNPWQKDPEQGQRYALYFDPPPSAGGRLCRNILGMDGRGYLRAFERRNLLHQPRWSIPAARKAADDLKREMAKSGRAVVVLLGRKVFDAWDDWRLAKMQNREWSGKWEPFTSLWWQGDRIVLLPHPSGLCREWNAPGAYARAREVLVQAAPHLERVVGVAPTTLGPTKAERIRMSNAMENGRTT